MPNNADIQHSDDDYKKAFQPIVDDNMRSDRLGKHICKVLDEHNPTSKKIISLITDAITANPEMKKQISQLITAEIASNSDLKDSIKKVIEEHGDSSKIKWFHRITGGIVGVIMATIGAFIAWYINYALPVHAGK
jgi:hypothetical protein